MASEVSGGAIADLPDPGNTSGVLVSCRLRELSAAEQSSGHREAALAVDSVQNSISVSIGATAVGHHAFQFDHVFSPCATQDDIFSVVGAPCVRDVLLGYNCTLLAYGQTGSGKTHTTIGGGGASGSPNQDGLVPRMLELLLTSVAQEPDTTLTASFIEVYQERLRDLLLPVSSSSSSSLRIRDDKSAGGGVWVDGATEIVLRDLATARAAVQRGLRHRAVGATQMNRDSSRSHAVFAVTLTRRDTSKAASSPRLLRARLCVVDLAGSEQAKKTRASGARLDEAKHINRSLSALGNVIHALTSGNSATYVPYRDSKLTRLLQSSLGGNAKTHLLLTCAMASGHAEETLSTLRFGARAKHMRNKPTVNVNAAGTATDQGGAAQQRELLATLERKIESLCRYIRELEDTAATACCRCGAVDKVSDAPTTTLEITEDEPASEIAESDERETTPVETEPPVISNDLLMRAELLTLRQALDEMQRLYQHEQLHARRVLDAVNIIEQNEIEKLHARQARDIERLEEQLAAAEREIATLQQELRVQHETQSELTRKLRHAESALKRDETAASAESEILRRRLDQSDRLLRTIQLELSASRAEAADLHLTVESGELERARIRDELDATVQKLHATMTATTFKEAPPSPPVPSIRAKTKPVLRPVTVSPGGSTSGAIQNWWAGDTACSTNNCHDDDDSARRTPPANGNAVGLPSEEALSSRHTEEGAPSVLVRASRCTTSVGRNRLDSLDCDSGDRLPGRDNEANTAVERKQQLHTSGGARPFRARLVGLLTSLEAETSSYKELLLDAGSSTGSSAMDESAALARPRAAHSRNHLRRQRLPELAATTASSKTTLTPPQEEG